MVTHALCRCMLAVEKVQKKCDNANSNNQQGGNICNDVSALLVILQYIQEYRQVDILMLYK